MFDKYPYLRNDRVIIRKMTLDDAESLKTLTDEAAVYKTVPAFLYELKYPDKEDVIRNMDEECFKTRESILMGVFLTDLPDVMVGIAEIYNYDENKKKASIGCRLDERYFGRGIGTAVAFLLRDYLIKDEGLQTVTAHILSVNEASKRVIEKAGFVKKYAGFYEDWGFDELMLTDKFVFKSEWAECSDDSHENPRADVEVEQFVMAYEADQDRIRALLPDGFVSLRPVLRINSEIRNGEVLYLELNTPVEAFGRRGWLNIANWKSKHDDIGFKVLENSEDPSADGRRTVEISAPFIELRYTGVGIEGGCPAEKDNEGCYYIGSDLEFRPAEKISENKEFCDCSFRWTFHAGDASGVSQGRTLPAFFEEPQNEYEKQELTAENAAAIPCRQVLGAYIVRFIRQRK